MKNMLFGSPLTQRSWVRSTTAAIVGLAVGLSFWAISAPSTLGAPDQGPMRMVEANLPQGKTIATASKADLLAALCKAVQKNPKAAPQIARMVAAARPDLAKDILRTAFRCLSNNGNNDCGLLGRVLRSVIEAVPDQASALTTIAVEAAPDCAGSFPGNGVPGSGAGGGSFDQGVGNQNPPPGTIAGGGGQGNVVAVCYNGTTRFFSPSAAESFINGHPGATLGACQVTAVTNQ